MMERWRLEQLRSESKIAESCKCEGKMEREEGGIERRL